MKKLCSRQSASTARGCIICTVHAWELLPLTHGVNEISTTRCGMGCSCDDRYSILRSIERLWCDRAPQGRVECIDWHWDCTGVLCSCLPSECRGTSVTPSGRRFSQRLQEKKRKQSSGAVHVPTAPPPPPLPPVCVKKEEPNSPEHALKVRS